MSPIKKFDRIVWLFIGEDFSVLINSNYIIMNSDDVLEWNILNPLSLIYLVHFTSSKWRNFLF